MLIMYIVEQFLLSDAVTKRFLRIGLPIIIIVIALIIVALVVYCRARKDRSNQSSKKYRAATAVKNPAFNNNE